MAPLYKPPTKWPTVPMPWLALVHKADPDFERKKHREVEYVASSGRVFRADPYHRGAFETPEKTVTVSYSGPLTFAAGDLTGVGGDVVILINESLTPGVLTTRTAAQMFADITGAVPNVGHFLRMVNNLNGADMIVQPGAGVIVKDRADWQISQIVVRRMTYVEIRAQFPDAAHAVFTVDSIGSPYSALIG